MTPERMNSGKANPETALAKDPVCDMNVDPATARGSAGYKGQTYYFCSQHCVQRFNADPEKYQAQKDEYRLAVRNFIANAPDSVKGMDLELVSLNPYAKWGALEAKQRQATDSRAFRLAQERYVVARTQTDLDGRGSFAGVAPGKYWIGMLGEEAVSGDVHVHWDVPVTVRRGQTASLELSNFNAASSGTTAQNSNN